MFVAGTDLDSPFLSVIGRVGMAYGRGVAPQGEAPRNNGWGQDAILDPGVVPDLPFLPVIGRAGWVSWKGRSRPTRPGRVLCLVPLCLNRIDA